MAEPGGNQSLPGGPPAQTVTHEAQVRSERLPGRIGGYHVKRVIASGGMGTVFEATQENPRRVVAVKVMKQGIASRSAMRRFEHEGQILGRLRHPGIAQIFEAGMHVDRDGLLGPANASVLYFAMEYIPNAKPITTYADEKKLGTRQRMKLFAEVCDAVHHGHQKGIIHRDLKPSNILVDSTGQVKIIDFGVARSTDSDLAVTTLQTDVGQLIGTLQYMSPEQCDADPHDIDIRSDVYALGVVLYELLCGKPPYDLTSMAVHHATRIIREQHPTRLSTLNRALRGDVETIALKALEKERERRYQSAAEFARDIERYLIGEAILARRASIVYHLRLFARRNKAVFGAISVALVVLIAGLIGTSWGMIRARDAERIAVQKSATAERVSLFLADWLEGIDPVRLANALRGDLLERHLRTKNKPDEPDEAGSDAGFVGHLDRVNLVDVAQELVRTEILLRAEVCIGEQLQEEPEVAGRLSLAIGTACHCQNLPVDAERNLLRARTLLEQTHGPDKWTMSALDTLGGVYRKSGRYDDAARVYLELLEMKRETPDTPEFSVLETSNWLGDTYRYQGRYHEAEAMLTEALSQLRRIVGDRHTTTLTAMNNLALVFADQLRFEESEDLLREALAGLAETAGEDHRETTNTRINLGNNLRKQGRLVEAETLYRRALADARRTLGDDHWITLSAVHSLAHARQDQGDFEASERLHRESLAVTRRLRGDQHQDTARDMNCLALVLLVKKEYETAEGLLREALSIRRALFGNEHREVGTSLNNLGYALVEAGKFQEAAEVLGESVKVLTVALGNKDFQVGNARSHLGKCLTDLGRFEAAESELIAAQPILDEGGPRHRSNTIRNITRIIELYDVWDAAAPGKGYAEKAAEWRAKLEATQTQKP